MSNQEFELSEERAARLLLASCVGEPIRLRERLRSDGAVAVLAQLRGEPGPWQSRLRASSVDAVLVAAERCGARVVVPGDGEWPSQLDDLGAAAPLALWVIGAGNLRLLALRSVAVVGARAATPYGLSVAEAFAAGLTQAGFSVISGGAYGIDAAAHRGALTAGGVTISVLAGGVDVPYPLGNQALLARIADDGLLVSQSPPGTAPQRHRFLTRNHMIAALTRATVVVEAALRSGTTATANAAFALNRPVLAVPGSVHSAASAGCHVLIRDKGAVLATRVEDVLELIAPMGDLPVDRQPPATPYDELPIAQARVLDALPARAAVDLEVLVEQVGLGVAPTLAALGALQVRGLVQADPQGWRLRR
jgi:DNA processing protein